MPKSCAEFTVVMTKFFASPIATKCLWPGTQATDASRAIKSFKIFLYLTVTFEAVWLHWKDLMEAWLSE